MKFKFIISKWANLYFFVSNLSEWHFSCRKDYNIAWLKLGGNLTKQEIEALSQFKKIINYYKFKLGNYFFLNSEKECWRKLSHNIKKSELETIKSTFRIVAPRFEKIWQNQELNKRAASLKKTLNQKNYRNEFAELQNFFDIKNNYLKFNIIALFSPLRGEGITAAGGANLNNKSITLEIPFLKQNSWELEYSINVLLHEIAHIFLKKSDIIKIIEGIIKNLKLPQRMPQIIKPQYSILELITELIIESLLPYGYLAQKYSKFDSFNIYFSKYNLKILGENYQNYKNKKLTSGTRLKKIIIWQLLPFIISYIDSNKKIDRNFIQEIAVSVSKLIK